VSGAPLLTILQGYRVTAVLLLFFFSSFLLCVRVGFAVVRDHPYSIDNAAGQRLVEKEEKLSSLIALTWQKTHLKAALGSTILTTPMMPSTTKHPCACHTTHSVWWTSAKTIFTSLLCISRQFYHLSCQTKLIKPRFNETSLSFSLNNVYKQLF
jgi:hypothetical protein